MTDSAVSIQGRVDRMVFRDESSRFTVLHLDTGETTVTVVGELPSVRPGASYQVEGHWVNHPRYGRQLRASIWREKAPENRGEFEGLLKSGLIDGVGPTLANRLLKEWSDQTLEQLLEEPDRLLEIEGIGKARRDQILESLKEHKHLQQLMGFAAEHRLPIAVVLRVYDVYGESTLDTLQQDPYRLIEQVRGIGFTTADRLALKLGIAAHAPERLEAAVLHSLREVAASEGHLYLSKKDCLQRSGRLLSHRGDEDEVWDIERALRETLQKLIASGDLAAYGDHLYLRRYDQAEQEVARRLAEHIRWGSASSFGQKTHQMDERLDQVGSELPIDWHPKQRDAIRSALQHPVYIITGGPGTGKTTIVDGIIRTAQALDDSVTILQAAPTGRAAQRMEEMTGIEAKTIHRLLEYGISGGVPYFGRDQAHPLEGDLLIIDESSMIDILLMEHLLNAVPPGLRLVFVGDADQLPPVGPGHVLHDLISADVIPSTRLTRIFRQKEASGIVRTAHAVRRGRQPHLRDLDDVSFIRTEDPERIGEMVVDSAVKLGRELDTEEVQVLSPMHRGPAGVDRLNRALKKRINPTPEQSVRMGSRQWGLGDKVMCIRNNYTKGSSGIFNGTLGWVTEIKDEQLGVDFDGERVSYEAGEIKDLKLAYAITVHKAQGSEFPAIVLPVTTSHYIMLDRRLLYTAVTRARQRLVLVGSRKALQIALQRTGQRQRNTRLAERIRQQLP